MSDSFQPAYRMTISGLVRMESGDFGNPDHVISILDPGWEVPGPLVDRDKDSLTSLRFHDEVQPAPGVQLPSREDVVSLVRLGEHLVGNGCSHLHVHCHMGVSRSTAVAAIVRVAAAPNQIQEAFDEIDRIRIRNWPNSLMIGFADEILDLGGAMTQALIAHHRRVAERDPDLAEVIIAHGRGHEVLES